MTGFLPLVLATALSGCATGEPEIYTCTQDGGTHDLSCDAVASVVWCGRRSVGDLSECGWASWWESEDAAWVDCTEQGEFRVGCVEGEPERHTCERNEDVDIGCKHVRAVVWCGVMDVMSRIECIQSGWWEGDDRVWTECWGPGELRIWCQKAEE